MQKKSPILFTVAKITLFSALFVDPAKYKNINKKQLR